MTTKEFKLDAPLLLSCILWLGVQCMHARFYMMAFWVCMLLRMYACMFAYIIQITFYQLKEGGKIQILQILLYERTMRYVRCYATLLTRESWKQKLSNLVPLILKPFYSRSPHISSDCFLWLYEFQFSPIPGRSEHPVKYVRY